MEVLVLCYHFRTTIINGISLEDDPLNLVNETISVDRVGDTAISPHTPVSSLYTCPPRKFSIGGGEVFLVSSDPMSLTIYIFLVGGYSW